MESTHLLWRTSGQSVYRYMPECAQFRAVSVGICVFAHNRRLLLLYGIFPYICRYTHHAVQLRETNPGTL